jgi:hypothetical protein
MLGRDLLPKIKATGRGDKFSENLMKWVRKHRNSPLFVAYSSISCIDGKRLPDFGFDKTCAGNLYIGFGDIDDGWLHGARLSEIICNGTKAKEWAYPPRMNFQKVDGWWERYMVSGKCTIDPEHTLYHDCERWQEDGDTRLCLWCGGHRQVKRRYQMEREEWRNEAV